jgi:hypothetical protein
MITGIPAFFSVATSGRTADHCSVVGARRAK